MKTRRDMLRFAESKSCSLSIVMAQICVDFSPTYVVDCYLGVGALILTLRMCGEWVQGPMGTSVALLLYYGR